MIEEHKVHYGGHLKALLLLPECPQVTNEATKH